MPASHDNYNGLSRFLHEALPSHHDLEKLCKTQRHTCVLAHEALTVPFTILDQKGLKTSESLLDIPDKDSHPVLIALYMIQLAVFLQYLPPNIHDEAGGFSELPRSLMERLANLATRLVITNDELLGSIEGLECIMIEGLYQANLGNLRRSWVTGRRALGIAQLMGLNRLDNRAQFKVLDPKTKFDPQFMWFRINFLDRYLCLLLGVPQGCLDRSMASDTLLANDTPMERLDRIHCVIASRILERNDSNLSADGLALTRALDMELQKAARVVPSTWWLAPNLDSRETDSQSLYWDTRRLISQVFHYNLLNQLHLPYMLHYKSVGHKHEYSRITCVNASREVLSRFIALRSFNKLAYSCRTVDFLALMSAMTLLLAHLTSKPSETESLLAHQYHSDRAMIEQAQKNMMEVNRLSSDALSAQSADLLRKLLALDVEAPDGSAPSPGRVRVQPAENKSAPDSDLIASVHVPYFGFIKILREGMGRKVHAEVVTTQLHRPTQSQAMRRNGTTNPAPTSVDLYQNLSGDVEPAGLSISENTTRNSMDDHRAEVASNPTQKAALGYEATQPSLRVSSDPTPGEIYLSSGTGLYEPMLQCGGYHEIAAGGEDWAFQGVDMAFFESLMRSTSDAVSEITKRDHKVG